MGIQLKIYLHEKYQGDILQDKNGRYSFIPSNTDSIAHFAQCPLSLSFLKTYPNLKHDRIRTFLNNLKSENERWIKQKGIEYKFDINDSIAYFEHFGLDCAGAIQIIKPGEENKIYRSDGSLTPIAMEEIGEELLRITNGRPTKFITDKQRLSISGAENKIGLTKINNEWFISNGTIPSTHIIKFLPPDKRDQHISEFLSLKILEKILPNGTISQCEYKDLGGMSCIISERYDREISNGSIKRIHQEDFCQILGINPQNKYEIHGGPNATTILDVICKYSHHPENDTKTFISCLFLNYIMMCPDGHGKNYSMLIRENDFCFAPIYDFTSIAYRELSNISDGLTETAMGIDGKRKYRTITTDNVSRFLAKNNLPEQEYIKMLNTYCEKLPSAINQTFSEYSDILKISDEFQINFIGNVNNSIAHFSERIKKLGMFNKTELNGQI